MSIFNRLFLFFCIFFISVTTLAQSFKIEVVDSLKMSFHENEFVLHSGGVFLDEEVSTILNFKVETIQGNNKFVRVSGSAVEMKTGEILPFTKILVFKSLKNSINCSQFCFVSEDGQFEFIVEKSEFLYFAVGLNGNESKVYKIFLE